ncbi:MAG TPA: RNA methyltransferase [Candidatus Microthrix parvicella]|jgi:tRNA G18 (ribose-2'-O)-methylase SpoU|uniref:TrmH family RNA methyltransferase n=1 Tax=Candidatus Neomicrothrix TaxID=41949 RepID=UPI000379FB42|nr:MULTISPECIES: RNA methyltransferase [Microthrix]MBK7021038.1 RNA methyltransferase [Candidatus Microthrix sp.]MBP7995034.1 RNA methyltransferase [Candidatus Microthrix sp.]HBX08873.1 RNA methyltransferase [Candidatus Microthrix parvicella]
MSQGPEQHADNEIPLADANDPRLAPYRLLTDRALRDRAPSSPTEVSATENAPHGRFLAEGHYVLQRLIAAGAPVLSVMLTERRAAAAREYLSTFRGPRYLVSEELASKVVGYPVHRGVMGLVARPRPLTPAELTIDASLLVYLDGIADTENVGAIFRTAAALGADGVLVGPTTADPLYRRCVRVSMGATAVLSWARDTGGDALSRLNGGPLSGWSLVGLSPDGSTTLEHLVEHQPPRSVLILGSEGPGLGDKVRRDCDELVSIPIGADSDSLNVAATAAIALYRLAARRNGDSRHSGQTK